MTIPFSALRQTSRLTHALINIIILVSTLAILLPAKSFSQASSQMKKPVIYQIGNVLHINADSPRPLLRALDALQDHYGWVVNYEDPQQSTDVGATPYPRRRNPRVRNFNQRGFSATIDLNLGADGRPDESATLTAIVNTFDTNNTVSHFDLRQKDGRFDVIGATIHQDDNDQAAPAPILDLPITLTQERRNAVNTIIAICEKLSIEGKVPVTLGGTAGDPHQQATMMTISGEGVPARILLSRALEAMGGHLSWRLLYDSTREVYELELSNNPSK